MKRRALYAAWGVLVLGAPGRGHAVEPDAGAGEEKPYHLEADVTEAWTANTERVLHGTGNVLIVHGTTTITCDEVFSYEERKFATLSGRVKVVDTEKKYTLTAGYAEYFRDKKMATASRNPKLVLEKKRQIIITSDLMQMWNDREYGEAVGNVHITSEDVEGDGQKLEYFGKEDRIELTGQPVVWQRDNRLAGEKITLFLEGDQINRAEAEGSARLLYFSRRGAGDEETDTSSPEKEESAAEGPLGPEEGRDEITIVPAPPATEKGSPPENPDVVPAAGRDDGEGPPSGRTEAAGDKMVGIFTGGELERVTVTGDAQGHYWPMDDWGRETGEKIDLAGREITITARNGRVRKIVVSENAEGQYRPAATEGRAGVTHTSGDAITVFVTANKVRRIVVTGHARGSYYTEQQEPKPNEKPR